MAIVYWLRRPVKAVARVRYWLWERANPDKPWLCPGTVAFCQANLNKRMTAIEFGSGRSTRWFSSLVSRLISVEHQAEWFKLVQKQLADANIANVDYRLIPLNHPELAPERNDYSPLPDYVAVADRLENQSIDFAMVDGHYRTNCVKHLIPKIRPGGYLLVDDINMWHLITDLPIPVDWRIADDSTNGIKRCVIWQVPQSHSS